MTPKPSVWERQTYTQKRQHVVVSAVPDLLSANSLLGVMLFIQPS